MTESNEVRKVSKICTRRSGRENDDSKSVGAGLSVVFRRHVLAPDGVQVRDAVHFNSDPCRSVVVFRWHVLAPDGVQVRDAVHFNSDPCRSVVVFRRHVLAPDGVQVRDAVHLQL